MAYSPTMARWMEQDPLGYVDGPNTYQFVGDGPINRIDPGGELWGWVAVAGAGLALVGGIFWYESKPAHTADLNLPCPELQKIRDAVQGGRNALQKALDQNPTNIADLEAKLKAQGSAVVGTFGVGVEEAGATTSANNQRFIDMVESTRYTNNNVGTVTHPVMGGQARADWTTWLQDEWGPAELQRLDAILKDIDDAMAKKGCKKKACSSDDFGYPTA